MSQSDHSRRQSAPLAFVDRPSVESLEGRRLLAAIAPDHIVIVIEQDRASDMIGNPIMPYLNSLAQTGLYYTNSHGVTHPSEPNTLALYSGSTHGITGNGRTHSFDTPNLARSLFDAGLTFAGFSENLPFDGSQATQAGVATWPDLYTRNMNAMAQFTNLGYDLSTGLLRTNAAVNKTFLAFETIPTNDYSSLPTVSFIVPNNLHSTHGSNEDYPWAGSPDEENNDLLRSMADDWLHDELDDYLQWAKVNNSLLIVTQDEERWTGGSSETVTTVINGDPDLFVPGVNDDYINHYSLLRTIEEMYDLPLLGESANAAPLATDALGRLAPENYVPPQGAPTSTIVTSNNTSVTVGDSVTFTATVSTAEGVLGGQVTFKAGDAVLGVASVDANGVATLNIVASSVGTFSITATYGGDAAHQASTSLALTQAVTKATTVTTLGSSGSSEYGQAVVLTASVTSAFGGLSGSVVFKAGDTTLGTASLNATGVATLSVSTLDVGEHSITATYTGDANHASSESAATTQSVSAAVTTTTLTASSSTSPAGGSVTFSAKVLTASGAGTGTVTFMIGDAVLGTGNLNSSGVATFSTSSLSLGTHSITAVYEQTARYAASASPAVSHEVVIVLNPTTTTLTSSLSTSVFGQAVTLTATVAATSGTPTGAVVFRDGTTVLGSASLNASRVASLTVASLGVGAHSITATYEGNSNHAVSTSNTRSVAVARASSKTTLSASATTSVFGQTVTFTATTTAVAPGQGVPTGFVTFKRGGTVIGIATLNAQGVATFSTASLPVGSHSVTASYSTTTNYNSSTSSTLTTTVNKISTTTSLSSSLNPSVVGQSVRFTATVAAVAPGTGVPTGQVQFRISGSNFGSPVTLVNGVAISPSTSSLSAGNRSITAVYLGNTQTASSTSATLTQTVVSSSNNNFSSRITLSGRNVSTIGTNVGATFESGEPKHAGVTGGRSVWWTWTPTVSGLVTIDTAGSNFDTLLAVYTGSSVSSLVSVASNNNADASVTTSKVTFNAVAGRSYRIAVDGNAGATGIIRLKLTQ